MVFSDFRLLTTTFRKLDHLPNWPEKVKTMQKNWIGKSEGASITFSLENSPHVDTLEVFTTRPDTILECPSVRYLQITL